MKATKTYRLRSLVENAVWMYKVPEVRERVEERVIPLDRLIKNYMYECIHRDRRLG